MRTVLGSDVSPRGEFLGWRCALALLITVATVGTAHAQTYKSIEPRLTQQEASALMGKVNVALRDPAGLGAGEADVRKYLMTFYFPQMTNYSPESLALLGKRRKDLFQNFIRKSPNAASLATLNDWAVKVGTAVAQGNYHPAVRYNAALILGNLDEKIAVGGAAPAPPVPLPTATVAMLELLEQGDFGGVTVHPSVKQGALVGLERHAQYGVAPQHAERVTKVTLDVMAQQEPPEDISKDVHQWMKCSAASVLAWQNRQKPDAQTIKALNALMMDESFDLDNRAYVAGLLNRLDFKQAAGLDAPAAANALGKLAQDVMKAESQLARDYQKQRAGDRNVDFGAIGRGRFDGGENLPKYERRRLASRLNNIRLGGTKLAEGLPDDTKAKVQQLLDVLGPVLATATDKNATDLGIADDVIAAAQEVDQLVQGWNAGGAAAAAEADSSSVSLR